MPPARHATATPHDRPSARDRPRPSRATRALRRPGPRLRWDRVGRIALLLVLCVVGGLYVQHAVAWLTSRAAYDREHANVVSLQRANAALMREERSLRNPSTILLDARRLGMVRPGERPYVLSGVPGQGTPGPGGHA